MNHLDITSIGVVLMLEIIDSKLSFKNYALLCSIPIQDVASYNCNKIIVIEWCM